MRIRPNAQGEAFGFVLLEVEPAAQSGVTVRKAKQWLVCSRCIILGKDSSIEMIKKELLETF